MEAVALYIYDGEWKCAIYRGNHDGVRKLDVKKSLGMITEIKDISESGVPELLDFDIIIPVSHKKKPLAYAVIAKNKSEAMDDDVIPFIQTLTNIVAVAIENKNLGKEQIRQAGIKRELEFAAEMQAMLFPEQLPDNKEFEMHATYHPHREVGGDYYDYIRLVNFESLICMADVSGKGVPAALLMSNFQANLHALANNYSSLPKLASQLNTRVIKTAKGEKFITVFLGKYNAQTHVMHYVNAGHNPPILYDGKEMTLLSEGSTGLGMLDDLPFVQEGIVNIRPGTFLLCYTDGLVETENESGMAYGMERLRNFISENAKTGTLASFHEKLLHEIESFKGDGPHADDITLLSARFH
jgi:sigma-B regulation protein RsbU (phosphoserine phosphatase)